MIRIAVCEDNIKDLAHLLHILGKTNILCDITEYQDAESMLYDVESCGRKFDLFLLDIYLPGMTGVEAARCIRAQYKNALLAFLSTSEDFYREAFDLYALHYLKYCRWPLTSSTARKKRCESPLAEKIPYFASRKSLMCPAPTISCSFICRMEQRIPPTANLTKYNRDWPSTVLFAVIRVSL